MWLGTGWHQEIESAALTLPEVAEAAGVPVIDDIRGRVVEVYVSLNPPSSRARRWSKRSARRSMIRLARSPAEERLDRPDMPETRSGKTMRGLSRRSLTSLT